ncbi:MAG TPA: hypothetical protein VKH81_13955 [Candidatus Angelobacter sp.]|nr:hypothetical protein [Candidatus Angelobacter sp.]
MEAERDYRLIGFGVIALMITVGVGIGVALRPKTPFQREHARAEAANPMWLRVEISTADHRSEYGENESIYMVARFSSAERYKYKVETAEGESPSVLDVVHISNGRKALFNNSILCCFSRLVGLDEEPYVSKAPLPFKLPPGRYQIYVTSRRVFKWDIGREEYQPSWFEVASNMLEIRVVPDHK